jgi:predicted helicase
MAELQRVLDTLPQDAHGRGKAFESLCKWFLENDPTYAALLEDVWLWSEWPGRWGADAGIDLVARAFDGSLWAIQAKCYAPEYTITKQDVDTFLSESGRALFQYRLIIGTTDRVGPRATSTLAAQEKPAHFLGRSSLEQSLIWPASFRELAPLAPVRPTPLLHQREAIDAVLEGYRHGDERLQLLMACGTGKTNVGAWIAEALGAARTVVLVPSLSLLSQTLRSWTAARHDFEFLVVCSDETTVDDDDFLGTPVHLAVPVTTEVAAIAAAISVPRRHPLVVFSTYQSSPRVAEALRDEGGADLVVADEAHRCVAGEQISQPQSPPPQL